MMTHRSPSSPTIPFLFGLVACASAAPPSVGQPPAPPPVPSATSIAGAAVSHPDASPTQRTPDQKARDDARAPIANAILSAYTNFAPTLSPDRTKVLFASRRDGNREFYLGDVARPTAPPTAITHGTERANDAAFTRDGKAVLFIRDRGADENDRIYRVGLDGKDETCLTPGPALRRSMPIEPDGKPGALVYSQRDVKTAATDIVVQAIGGEPKVVYTDPSFTNVTSVTRDGRRALIRRRYSSSDYVLFELALDTGKTRRLHPAEGTKVTIHDATYSPDGKLAYVSGDDGAEGELLFAVDLASGSTTRQYRQLELPTATIDSVLVSPRGDRLAIDIDEGDHAEARILDAKSLEPKARVAAPPGRIGLASFSDDGAKIAATISTADAPSDVFQIDSITGAVEPLRSDARPGLAELPSTDATIEAVKAFDGLSLPVIVYLPKGARTSGKRLPVIVQFHGGPAGSESIGWDPFAKFFTALGYAFIEPNVRGSTGYGRAYEMADNREKRADWLRDLESVNAWSKAQTWADPRRVVVMGGSYGGYTVLMALTRQPTLWRAGVDYVGIANLFTFLGATDQYIRAVWVDEFGDLDKDRALLEEFSPLRDKDRIAMPLYVYAGENDTRVPREESDQVVRALRGRGVPVEYQVAVDEGHSLDHQANKVEFLTRVARFLEDNVR